MTATARGPASTWWASGAFLNAMARSRTRCCSAGLRSSSRRKWRTMVSGVLRGRGREGRVEEGGQCGQELVGLRGGEDQRRGQADGVGGRGVDDEAGLQG